MPMPADAHVKAAVAEVRLMLDYIGNLSKASIAGLALSSPAEKPEAGLNAEQVLTRFSVIATETNADREVKPCDAAFVALLRDKLNGMTVAYTWMVSGRSNYKGSRIGGEDTHGLRFELAKDAYPGLQTKARLHNIFSLIFLVLAILTTGFAVWQATKVALGKSLLASLQELRTQQGTLNVAKTKLTGDGDDKTKSAGQNPAFSHAGWFLRPCENTSYRYYSLKQDEKDALNAWNESHRQLGDNNKVSEVQIFSSSSEQETCDQDAILAGKFGVYYHSLRLYEENWPGLVGRTFSVAQMLADIPAKIYLNAVRSISPATAAAQSNKPADAQQVINDIEWVVVARLLVLGNYVLPVVFALLGAIAFVMVDYFNKVKRNLLLPSDLGLAWIRLVLGLLVGACIGLLYSSTFPASQAPGTAAGVAGLLNTLSLSASGVAFLAGFGVEGVFSALEALVRRAFPVNGDSKQA
jgi:hypothetical protein